MIAKKLFVGLAQPLAPEELKFKTQLTIHVRKRRTLRVWLTKQCVAWENCKTLARFAHGFLSSSGLDF